LWFAFDAFSLIAILVLRAGPSEVEIWYEYPQTTRQSYPHSPVNSTAVDPKRSLVAGSGDREKW